MSDSDFRDYFNNKITQEIEKNAERGVSSKYDEIQSALDEKIASFKKMRVERIARDKANKDSWVTKLGLNPESATGRAVNIAASTISGGSKNVVGTLASLPVDAWAIAQSMSLNEGDVQAYNRYIQGTATEDDVTRLNSPKAEDIYDPSTVMERIQKINATREYGRRVVDNLDIGNIVHQDAREGLRQSLRNDTTKAGLEQVAQGWNQLKVGEDGSGLSNMAQGVGSLALEAGKAAIENPQAAAEYIAENAPQLAVGAIAKIGGGLLAATNMGYGLDLYQQGMENYAKENGGQIAPEEVRKDMAMSAAGATIAEHAGDKLGLALAKTAGETAKEAAKTTFKQALLNTTKATAGGVGSEAATEGVQTYLEGEATRKPASAQDIYEGATIGGIAGGGMSGGARGVGEALKATPEWSEFRLAESQKVLDQADAIKNNDITGLENEPVKAIRVLQAHAQLADTTPEVKAANEAKIQELVSKMEKDRQVLYGQTAAGMQESRDMLDALTPDERVANQPLIDAFAKEEAAFKGMTPAQIKETEAKLERMDRQLEQVRKLQTMGQQQQAQQIDLEAEVNTLSTPVDPQDPTTVAPHQEAANRVITLAMAAPNRVSAETATQLAADTTNGLSDSQRSFLTSYAEARAAEAGLKTMGKVGDEILNGDPKTGQMGIVQYRSQIMSALQAGNEKAAARLMVGLEKWVKNQNQKNDQITSAMEQFLQTNTPVQLTVQNRPYEISARSKNLVANIQSSTLALNSAFAEIKSMQALRSAPAAVNSQVQSTAAIPTESQSQVSSGNPVINSTAETSVLNQSNVNNTVDSAAPSTSAPVTNQPASETPDVVEPPVQEVKAKKAKAPPEKRDDLVGAILRVTGGAGLSRKIVEDALGDKVSTSRNGIKHLVRGENGTQDLGDVAMLLQMEEGYDVKDGAHLAELLKQHSDGSKVYSMERNERDFARNEQKKEQTYKREVSEQAKALGLKGIRGGRKLEHVLADIARYEAERSAMEAAEEREAIQLESEMSAELAANGGDIDSILNQLSDVESLSVGELTNEQSNSTNEGNPAATTQSVTQEGTQERSDAGDAEARESSDGSSTTEEPNAGKLSVFDKAQDWAGKQLGEVYQKLNLVAEFVTQKLMKDGEKTHRPLVAVKDFLSAWNQDAGLAKTYTGVDVLTDNQVKALANFKETANRWMKLVQENLVNGYFNQTENRVKANPDFRYTDPIQFLLEQVNGKTDLEENVKLAIVQAAYSWVAENGYMSAFSTEEEVKAMFGVPEQEQISSKFFNLVQDKGVNEQHLANSMGQKVIQALGLKAKKDAPKNIMAQLAASLGMHAMKILLDDKILERTTISQPDMKKGIPAKYLMSSDPRSELGMVRLARNKDMSLADKAKAITEANKGSQSILSKLFGVESDLIAPNWEAKEPTQSRIKNTMQGIPKLLKKYMKHEDSVPNKVRQDTWSLLSAMDQSVVLAIAGYEDFDPDTTHITNQKSLQAKNEGLVREFERVRDYFKELVDLSPLKLDQPLFFTHNVWKQQRVGIETNYINPQTSKLHRGLLYRPEWETVVSSTDAAMMDNFRLRVMEGLGVKTDKQGNTASLADFERMTDPASQDEKVVAIREAVQAIQDSWDPVTHTWPEEQIPVEYQQAILDGVKVGGEAMHSLDALIALAEYQTAKAQGKEFKFTVRMMGEIDGVTNGPMLSHLLLGAAASVEALFDLLNKGGFYQVGSAFKNYNLWRDPSNGLGHRDLYETTIGHVMDNINAKAATSPEMEKLQTAIWKITGRLEKDGNILKDGRNIIKKPLTAMIFGSAVDGAIRGMLDEFIAKTYEGFEKMARLPADKQEAARKDYLMNLDFIFREQNATRIPNLSIEDLMKYEFDASQIDALTSAFNKTLGEAVAETMEKHFSSFMSTRRQINSTAQASFAIYDAIYQSIKQEFLQELADRGEIFSLVRNKQGVIQNDLTELQEKELQQRIAAVNPVLNTLMSQRSGGDLSTGLHMSKDSRRFSKDAAYQTAVKFAKRLGKGYSLVVSAYEQAMTAPGVAMLPMMVHSLDSAISHMAAFNTQVLNVHDAHGSGLQHFTRTAQRLNQSTWKAVLEYSPTAEMRDAWFRTVEGLDQILHSGESVEAMVPAVKAALQELAKKYGDYGEPLKLDRVLTTITDQMVQTAFDADTIRLTALQQMGYIDQYALEGGHYEVTDADRAEASKKLAALSSVIDPKILATIDRINATLAQTKAAPKAVPTVVQPMEEMAPETKVVNTPFGKVGPSQTASDPAIVAVFKKKPTMTGIEALRVAYASLKPSKNERMKAFYRGLITKLAEVSPNALTVTFVTPDTMPENVKQSAEGIPQDARGWFVTTPEGHIYVLSPEFENSGLTAETLIHEVLHAALVSVVNAAADNKADPAVKELVQELNDLMKAAESYVNTSIPQNERSNYTSAVTNLHEFLAYGMSNTAFQRNVLSKINFASKTQGNKLVNGMKAFINALTNILFRGSDKTQQQIMENGLTVLIQNVSGLMEAAAPKSNNVTTLKMAAPNPKDYTTLSMFDALRPVNTTLTPTFETHLKDLLGGIVEKLHGPFGSLMASRMTKQVLSPADIWAKAKVDGVALFAQEALASGFPFSDQEAFAIQQVEATVRAALSSNETMATQSYKELSKLYMEMRNVLAKDGSDFNTGDPVQDQAIYDFIFKMEAGPDGKTDHLSRFAALGLANQSFNKVLERATATTSKNPNAGLSARLTAWFSGVLEWLTSKVTHTYAGQQANEKLMALVDNLVHIEQQTQARLAAPAANNFLDSIEEKSNQLAEKAKKGIGDLAKSRLIQNSSNAFVQLAGSVTSMIAQDRVNQYMNALEAFRDKHFKENLGVTAGIINEIRGAREGNMVFHALLRASKHLEGLRKSLMTNTSKLVLESFKDKGANLSKDEQDSITSVFLRTDIAALVDTLGMVGIQRVLNSQSALASEIAQLETQLNAYPDLQHFYTKEAKVLGYYMATGKVRGTHLLLNARNIARAEGTTRTKRLTEAQYKAAEKIIDQLVSLYALRYTGIASNPKGQKALIHARNVLNGEMNRGTENGVEMVLKLHQQLQQQSKDRLFQNSEALMMKGYTPEIYNPHREVVVADAIKGKELKAMGYKEIAQVKNDPKDPDQTVRSIYMLEHGGLRSHLTGIFSYTGRRSKGSRAATDEVQDLTEWKANQDNLKAMHKDKQSEIAKLFDPDPNFDPSRIKDNFAVPVFNPTGGVVDYRYLMQNETKDKLLQRDNRFDEVMGKLAGGIFDKQTSAEQNEIAVQALLDQKNADWATRSDSYIYIGNSSMNQEHRDMYRLLPEETKKAVEKIWGEPGMWVRVDLLDINFGYRKQSLSSLFEPDYKVKGFADKAFIDIATYLMGKKAGLRIRQTEDIFQEIVRETKDILVVKTGLTLLGNVTSNFTLLSWYGVPLKDQLHHHKVALRGAMEYKKNTAALTKLQLQLDSGYITGSRAEMEREILRLKNELERSPVKKFIDAGMMPTIVEDVADEEDIYSYKSNLVDKVSNFTSKLNPAVVAAGKNLYMAKDTTIYQAFSYGTQISDFLAKYTMYQYVTTRAKNPMSHEEAIQLASDAFVNYDIPSHRTVQYLNDMGIVWFTKYYLRIQKVIAHLYHEKPGRALMLLSLSHFFSGIPTLMDSSFVHKLHNPFSIGAFKYPSILDELATVKMGMSPFN